MADSPLQLAWDADREWIAEHTSWDRSGPAPDIIAAGVTPEEAFGGTEFVETAWRQSAEQAQSEWADSGEGKLREGIRRVAIRRCKVAKMAVEASLRGANPGRYVCRWWKLNAKLGALLGLLPGERWPRLRRLGQEDVAVGEELTIPETWNGRVPKPQREAEELFEGLTRKAEPGEPNVLDEVKDWVADAYWYYRRECGYGSEEAKDEIMRIAESHDYHFRRRNIGRWRDRN